MTDHGGSPPTFGARLLVAALTLMALAVGGLWMWMTARDVAYAGIPPWAVGLVVVGLVFALAWAVHRVQDHD